MNRTRAGERLRARRGSEPHGAASVPTTAQSGARISAPAIAPGADKANPKIMAADRAPNALPPVAFTTLPLFRSPLPDIALAPERPNAARRA